MLIHEVVVWYTSSEIKNNRKKIIFKLKVIQKRVLRRFIDVYKTIATKTLKVEIHVSFINIHLKKLLQSSIINMNAKRSINAIETAMQHIKRNLMSKKKTKVKVTNNFIANKKTKNAKTLKKDEGNVQSILHRRVMNELFENNHRN